METKKNDPKELLKAENEYEEAQYALDTFKANKKAIVTLGVDAWNDLLEEYVITRDAAQVHYESLKADAPELDYSELPLLWNEWTTESRREFLQTIVSRCIVDPANGEPDLVNRVDVEFDYAGAKINFHLTESEERAMAAGDFRNEDEVD
jgi:hypothetical protein